MQATDTDRRQAELLLRRYFKEMTQWEIDARFQHLRDTNQPIPNDLADVARPCSKQELDDQYYWILERHCTKKKRSYGGRPAGFRYPPTFGNQDRLEFVEVKAPKADRLEFFSNEWNDQQWKFVMLKRSGKWRLDNIQWYSAHSERWESQYL